MILTQYTNSARMHSIRSAAASPFMPFMLFILSFVLLFLPHGAKAQHVGGGHRRGDTTQVYRYVPPSDSIVEIRLVNLALQGPQFEALGHKVNVAQDQLMQARRAWFNLLTFSLQYNNLSFGKQVPGATYVYPKYFFGLVIPVGMFVSMGPQIHAARESVKVAQNNQDDLARTLRHDVLSDYRTYKNYEQLILLQNTVVVDQQAALTQIEQKFRDGTVSIDQYNLANKEFSDEKAKLLNLQLSQDLERLEIERMIGTSLESVIR